MAGHTYPTQTITPLGQVKATHTPPDTSGQFAVWAPNASHSVSVVINGERHPLEPAERGVWHCDVTAPAGARYGYEIDGYGPYPDPRSAHQPDGPHGLSEVVDQSAYQWSDREWQGFDLAGAVLYELHIGTFTPEGTFAAAAQHLDHLVELGVDAITIMPVATFPGQHGWGYDVVCPFSVHAPYGGPDGLKAFVDACHQRGIGVILDVVYNHLGPGAYQWCEYGPYFAADAATEWGPTPNLNGPGSDHVRAYVLDNAAMWVRDYHVDGLRLDAVHALHDRRATHLVADIKAVTQQVGDAVGRPVHLITEDDTRNPRVVLEQAQGGWGASAVWADDVHHALHVALTGETRGYYTDYTAHDAASLSLRQPFYLAGRYSSFHDRTQGIPVYPGTLPGHQFVVSVQNHDQVGNRAGGERLHHLTSIDRVLCGAALILTSAYTPVIFMGEEWAASTPWHFFCDLDDDAQRQAQTGRASLHARHGDLTPSSTDATPDARHASVLPWREMGEGEHRRVWEWYRTLVQLRRDHPALRDANLAAVQVRQYGQLFIVGRGEFRIVVNLGEDGTSTSIPSAKAMLASSRPEATTVRTSEHGQTVALPPSTAVIIGPA